MCIGAKSTTTYSTSARTSTTNPFSRFVTAGELRRSCTSPTWHMPVMALVEEHGSKTAWEEVTTHRMGRLISKSSTTPIRLEDSSDRPLTPLTAILCSNLGGSCESYSTTIIGTGFCLRSGTKLQNKSPCLADWISEPTKASTTLKYLICSVGTIS